LRQLEHNEIKNQAPFKELVVVCDRISDVRNIGMIFRVSEAFGVVKLFLPKQYSPTLTKKFKRITRSTESISQYYYESQDEVVKKLQGENFKIISIEVCDESVPLSRLKNLAFEKIALIIGAENSGVSEFFLNSSDEVGHIMMYGKNSSINVVNALSIALYQLREGNY